jgi:hypothetical protein
MKKSLILAFLFASLISCAPKSGNNAAPISQTETDDVCDSTLSKKGIYYWKTVFSLNDYEKEFLQKHDISRLYIRMFDVALQNQNATDTLALVPVGTIQFKDQVPEHMEVIPTVYITYESLRQLDAMSYNECDSYIDRILRRVENMVSFHELPNVKEVQFDCDWTESTHWTYRHICEAAKNRLNSKDIKFSITLRLHQMDDYYQMPADRGVLMLYNTGSFKNPNVTNSILTYNDAEPYIRKHCIEYPVDYAYPTYSWSLLYRDNEFKCIIRNIDLNDTSLYQKIDYNKYKVTKDTTAGDIRLEKGDIIRHETSEFKEIERVKSDLSRKHNMKNSRQIIYHLDSTNLSNYTNDEIEYMLMAY